jgi:hypothetical protein
MGTLAVSRTGAKFERVVIDLAIQRRTDHDGRGVVEDGVPVRYCFGSQFGCNIAARAGLVVNNHLLPKLL